MHNPESVRDRPTKAHATIFLLSKGQDYHYDVHAIPGPGGRRLPSVWAIPTELVKRSDNHADDHPAMMPMGLAMCCLSITGTPNGIVLDPYTRAGTTLLAAEKLG